MSWEIDEGPMSAWVVTAGLVIATPAARYMLDRFGFQPLGLRLLAGLKKSSQGTTPLAARRKLDRFCESAWKVTAYTALFAMGWYALHDQPWLLDSRHFWVGWPHQAIPWKVRVYYCGEMAFYTASLFMLLFWEERRSDFPVMLTHHLVTIILISMSDLMGYQRVGSIVMMLHDPSDVFLELAKVANYSGAETLSAACFAALLASWFLLRLVILPFWVVRSTTWEVVRVLGYAPPWSYCFNALLCALLVMHAYWFRLIVKVAIGQLRTGKTEDIREDKDDD